MIFCGFVLLSFNGYTFTEDVDQAIETGDVKKIKAEINLINAILSLESTPESIRKIVSHFEKNDYYFDWSYLEKKGKWEKAPGYIDEFDSGAKVVQDLLKQAEKRRVRLFEENSGNYTLEKLLVLLGDLYRKDVSFPMMVGQTNDNIFLKSFYADHAQYSARVLNYAHPDLGTFSRNNFNHVTPTSETIKISSRPRFGGTRIYALPGKTFTVTRIDKNDTYVAIMVNIIRPDAIKPFNQSKKMSANYSRPKWLRSNIHEIKAGESLKFTSNYGGPVYLEFIEEGIPVELRFDNVGIYPQLRSLSKKHLQTFIKLLEADLYDWVSIKLPSFELLSRRDLFMKSLEKEGLLYLSLTRL